MALLQTNCHLKQEEYNSVLIPQIHWEGKNSSKNVGYDFDVCAALQFRTFNAHSLFSLFHVFTLLFYLLLLHCNAAGIESTFIYFGLDSHFILIM